MFAKLSYLSILFCAALWAAAPRMVASLRCLRDSLRVFDTVTSHAMGLPLVHGRTVVPSGRLLSSHIRLTRSLTAET